MEIWKDIVGYEGKYMVSNLGRVKSYRYGKEKILKPGIVGGGYLSVCLYKDKKAKRHFVHRLVLTTFNPVADMKNLQVNHIDENKENNRLDNLEWCTCEYNINYGTRNKRTSESHKGKLGVKNPTSIPIVQLTLGGKLVNVFGSAKEAGRNGFTSTNITACIKGKKKTHKGYKWMYLHEYLLQKYPRISKLNLFGKEY